MKETQELTPVQIRAQIAGMLFNESRHMSQKFRDRIKYTGSLLTNSMVIAYESAINDTIKQILKENTDESKKD